MKPLKNVLIVDDELLVTESLRSMDEWAQRQLQVVGTASNGLEALAWIEREPIDIVITDIQMPDMNGLELTHAIRGLKDEIDVIIISGYEQFEYALTALRYQVRGYVLKPIDTDELFDIIDDILKETPIEVLDNRAQNTDTDSGTAPKTYHELLVERIVSHMNDHLGDPLTINEMAQRCYITPHYFGQIFKTVTGEYYTAYLTKLRMERACELLKNAELKIYQISSQVGYKDVKYFSKLFQKTYAVTPKQYRDDYFHKPQ